MKFLKYTLSLLLIVAISSCDSFLNEPEPEQDLPLEGGIETAQDLENLLTGAYNDIQDGDILGSQSVLFNEIMGDNTDWTGSFPTYVAISQRDMDSGNGSIDDLWDDYYDAVNTANIILTSLEDVEDPNLTQERADRIRGEALFIRGLLHYDAVRYFGLPWSTGNSSSNLGIPIKVTPVTSSSDFEAPPRNTVAEVYNAAIADLQEAQSLLPATSEGGKANSLVATALLSRINLEQGNYQAAADLAEQVINSGQYSLDPNVTALWFDELTGEQIFSIIHTLQDNPGVNNSLPAFYAVDGRDDVQISQDYLDATDQIITSSQQAALSAANQTAEDTRVTELLTVGSDGVPTGGVDNSLKYPSGANTDDNAVILRLPEMMLNRAEGLTEVSATLADVPQEVFDLINQIRRRAIVVIDANGDPGNEALIEYQRTDFTSKQELLDAILLERRVEFAFEGLRVPDLQRRQLDVRGLPYDSDLITFPIPQEEIDANPNIQQNPAYRN